MRRINTMMRDIWMERGFAMDPSCMLYARFYAMSPGQNVVYDETGNGRHITVTGAALQPRLLLAPDLVLNGTFQSGATGWDRVGNPSSYGLDSTNVYPTLPTNYKITASASGDGILCPQFTVVAGKSYWVNVCWATSSNSPTLSLVNSRLSGFPTSGGIRNQNGNHVYFAKHLATSSGVEQIKVTVDSAQDLWVSFCIVREILGYTTPCLRYDGIDDRWSSPQTIPYAGQATIMAWVNVNYINRWNSIFELDYNININIHVTQYEPTGALSYGVYNGSGQYKLGGTQDIHPHKLEQPQHIAFVANYGYYQLYVNSLLHSAGTLLDVQYGNFKLTSHAMGHPPRYGSIHEIAVFNRCLTPVEIANHYHVTRRRYE